MRKCAVGLPIQSIVRIKPPENKETIKVVGNRITLIDSSNRSKLFIIVQDQFDGPIVYNTNKISTVYDGTLNKYTTKVAEGYNLSVGVVGSSKTEKNLSLQGARGQPGLVKLFFQNLSNQLQSMRHMQGQSLRNFHYSFRCRYVQIIEQQIFDLFSFNKYGNKNLNVIQDQYQGPTIDDAKWLQGLSGKQIVQKFLNASRNRNRGVNEFGDISAKSSAIFTVQTFLSFSLINEMNTTNTVSETTFFQLPGTEVLGDSQDLLRIREDVSNQCLLSFSYALRDLSSQRNEAVIYQSSKVTHLLKNALGCNSVTLLLFHLEHMDYIGNAATLKLLKYGSGVQQYPIMNTGESIGLLRKFRMQKGRNIQGDKYQQIKKQRQNVQENLKKIRYQDDYKRILQKYTDLKAKYNDTMRTKSEVQLELIKCQEEKLEISKALVDSQIDNTKLLETIQDKEYELGKKLHSFEDQAFNFKVKGEQATGMLSNIQQKFNNLLQDKQDLQNEFIAVKKNYILVKKDIQIQKRKNQQLGIEVINLVNQNKVLSERLSNNFKKNGTSEGEVGRLYDKCLKLQKDKMDSKKQIQYLTADVERLRSQVIKYQIALRNQGSGQIRLGGQEFEGNSQRLRKLQYQKIQWQTLKNDTNTRIKLAQRKSQELQDRVGQLQQQLLQVQKQNKKIKGENEQQRTDYRMKLMQMGRQRDKEMGKGKGKDPKDELIKNFNIQEQELNQRIAKDRKKLFSQKTQISKMKIYARRLKHLAQDWAPRGIQLPQILSEEINSLDVSILDQNQEIEDLRNRNRKLQQQLMNQSRYTKRSSDSKQRLLQQIQNLKGKSIDLRRPGTSSAQVQQLKKQKNQLMQQIRRLNSILRDSNKNETNSIYKQNQLMKKQIEKLKSGNPTGIQSVSPNSGQTKNLLQKLAFYEQHLKSVQKQRSQLIVKLTMAQQKLRTVQQQAGIYQRQLAQRRRR